MVGGAITYKPSISKQLSISVSLTLFPSLYLSVYLTLSLFKHSLFYKPFVHLGIKKGGGRGS